MCLYCSFFTVFRGIAVFQARVVRQSEKEGNFHVFSYILTAPPDVRDAVHLTKDKYTYMSKVNAEVLYVR